MCANKVLSYFIPSPTSKGIRKYDTLFKHTQPPLSYSCLLQGLMEEQNLYVLHILNWQYCVNICGNNNNNNINDSNNIYFLVLKFDKRDRENLQRIQS